MSIHSITHEYVTVNGIKLHIAKQGSGKKLVVLLHGWPEFWYTWRYQIPVLAEHFTVVAPDLRGFNLSDKPHGVEHYKTDVVASDIAELCRFVFGTYRKTGRMQLSASENHAEKF